MSVLVLNSGSSSVKFQIVEPSSGEPIAVGLVEMIGEPEGHVSLEYKGNDFERRGRIADHAEGLRLAFEMLADAGIDLKSSDVTSVGHRVVHGGQVFYRPTIIDDDVLATISSLSSLAPLHNPPNVLGIEVARKELPDIPHVAVFDTAFFHGLPAAAATYAIDAAVAEEHGVRRYGFHGTSHEYVSQQVAIACGRELSSLNQIVLHLGNGASASAVRGGRAVDTSMGLTPLEGLVMGTRSGDIDAGVVMHLRRHANMTTDEIDTLLNRRSGLKGLAGVNDFRQLSERVAAGDEQATLAYEVYIHRLRKYIGAYMITLGRVDVITFTAGVGENASSVRSDALANLENYGIEIDHALNSQRSGVARVISTPESAITVMVVPTNEELAIARGASSACES